MSRAVQILQNYSDEVAPCVVATIGKHRLLFNMGEPFLRYYKQHGVKLTTNTKVLFTSNSLDCTNGIQNLLTSLYGDDTVGLSMYGPSKFVDVFNAFRCPYTRFLNYSFCDLVTHLKIIGVTDLARCRTLKEQEPIKFNEAYYQGSWNEYATSNFPKNSLIDPSACIDYSSKRITSDEFTIDYIEHTQTTLAYRVNLPIVKGKIDKTKLDEKKIPKNLLKKLFVEGTITIESTGEVVLLSEIQVPDRSGSSFLILECRSLDDVIAAMKNQRIIQQDSDESRLTMIVHYVSGSVILSAEFKQLLESFNESVLHILISQGLSEEVSQQTLNIVNMPYKHEDTVKQLYKDFQFCFKDISTKMVEFTCQKADVHLQAGRIDIRELFLGKNVSLAKRYFEFNLLGETSEYTFSEYRTNNFEDQIDPSSNYAQSVIQFKAKQNETIRYEQPFNTCFSSEYDPEILLLGTTCALPSKHRNNSAILVNISETASLMMDAGEGSYFQMWSVFGSECDSQMLKIKVIFITHFHADHHMGMQELILRREQAQVRRSINYEDDPIYLVLPWDMATWVEALKLSHPTLKFNEVYLQSINREDFEEYMSKQFIDSKLQNFKNIYETNKADLRNAKIREILQTNKARLESSLTSFESKCVEIGISNLQIVPVFHCIQSYAYTVTVGRENKKKIAYTGDTRPSDVFIQAARDADLMIHESTYAHGENDLAKKANHSTVTEAIEVALKANAKQLLLTHISKRHDKLDISIEGQSDEFAEFALQHTALAHDFLTFKLSRFSSIVEATKIASLIFSKSDTTSTTKTNCQQGNEKEIPPLDSESYEQPKDEVKEKKQSSRSLKKGKAQNEQPQQPQQARHNESVEVNREQELQ